MIQEFLNKLKNAKDPQSLSELHLEISYKFAELSEKYEQHLKEIILKKKELLETCKTVGRAEAEFELSSEGIFEKRVKITLKAYEKILSGIKRRLDSISEEVRNQY